MASSVFLLKRKRHKRGKSESHRELGREAEFTKAAQEGPHYDIKQDLIKIPHRIHTYSDVTKSDGMAL